ncbi:hypothetical protein I316_04624 [Kwoniella heveanensis BCC8398]|uniref:Cytochrome P450 n=1 Tax=Kwoniella heveanensis BCC8398 TaxID=1296120 RepID=A0A1B9GR58_9TREE|nr:hypothetical protein I316_04624 [Kwoniella heveanensis BCC8398]
MAELGKRLTIKLGELSGTEAFIWALVAFLGYRWVHMSARYVARLRHVRDIPSTPTLFFGFEKGPRTGLPHIPWVCPVNAYTPRQPWLKYERVRSDLIALPSLLSAHMAYLTASPRLAHIVSQNLDAFRKPTYLGRYTAMNVFGKNLLSAEDGDEHRRHATVIKRCFNECSMENVWDAMRRSLATMLTEEVEGLGNDGSVEDVRETMIRLTLLVIGSAGFGVDFPWTINETTDEDMPFAEALHMVEKSVMLQLLVPSWIMQNIPSAKLNRYALARKCFHAHLYTMYNAKRAELSADFHTEKNSRRDIPGDLMGSLVHSQLSVEEETRLEGGDRRLAGLTESEIIGNMCYLALYPEWQEEVHREVKAVCKSGMPGYGDLQRLPLCLAVCLEALRLRDVVVSNFKEATRDIIAPYSTWDEHGIISHHEHVIKQGSIVVIDQTAAQLNPFTWGSDRLNFNPRRHLAASYSRAIGFEGSGGRSPFVGFALGPRQCMGKRFAEVEMTSFISGVCSEYIIEPVGLNADESWEEMRTRMLDDTKEHLTLQPGRFAVRFVRR